MRLTQLRFWNIKGITADLDLAAINFLIGANFAGKTTRTDAIRLLFLGYLPELGKRNQDTFELSSGKEMGVSGQFDDGSSVVRRWFTEGDSVKVTSTTPPGWKGDAFAVMLNAETYFALSDRERVNYVFANLAQGRQEEVESAITAEAEKAKSAKEHAARMDKTAQGLAYLRTQDAPAIDLHTIDSERASLNAELLRLTEEKGRYAAVIEQAGSTRKRRESLSAAVVNKADKTAARDAISMAVDAKEHALAQIPATDDTMIARLDEDERAAAAALRDMERDLAMVTESIDRNETDLRELDSRANCPYCGAVGDGWKTIKRAEIESALAGLTTKRAQLQEHRLTVQEARASLAFALREARADARQRIDVGNSLVDLRSKLENTERLLEAIARNEEELKSLPPVDADALAQVEAIQTKLNVANERLNRLDLQRRAAVTRAADLQRLAQAEEEREKARADEATAKKAVEALREIQRQMVADAFKPLLESANGFFGDILKTPLAYNDGEIGTWRGGVWVGHHTFSGIEKLATYAAIQAALASTAPIRLMVLDEMLRAQNTKQLAAFDLLVAACKEAVRTGRIDQFIGIIPGDVESYLYLGDSASQVVAIG